MPYTLIDSYQHRELQQLIATRKQSLVITDENVAALYGDQFPQTTHGSWILKPGEASKTREEKARLEDQLLAWRFHRDALLIGIGGGMVLDFTGFCAATYMRGIDCLYLPTTLVAMVDASIGGKTAVNTPLGKNLIGAFHDPVSVWVNPNTLRTLSDEEFLSGAVEWLKHFLIAEPNTAKQVLCAKHPLSHIKGTLPDSILTSMSIKENLVHEDPFDRGRRQWLNLGHTLGHALEWGSPQTYPHGIAVGYGIKFAAWIAHEIGQISYKDWRIFDQGLGRMGFNSPVEIPCKRLIELTAVDKKSNQDGIHMIIPTSIGSVTQQFIPLTQLQSHLQKWLRTCASCV